MYTVVIAKADIAGADHMKATADMKFAHKDASVKVNKYCLIWRAPEGNISKVDTSIVDES